MNKRQKRVIQEYLREEKNIITQLKRVYGQAQDDCVNKIIDLNRRKDMQNLQGIIYQRQYQQALKKQLDAILDNLHTQQFLSLAEYLETSYTDGFIGTLYDLQGQGIPIIFPIDQSLVVKALQTDAKLSKGLYSRLGEDVDGLKQSIRAELSRGIANGSGWLDIAAQIANGMNSPFKRSINNAIRIARTEAHRIQNQAALDCQRKAKEHGVDIVKQWDATLDGKTRDTHMDLDGTIVELDEDFVTMYGDRAEAPGMFGVASEDINCRCYAMQRARWALGEEGTKMLGNVGEMSDDELTPIAEKLGIEVKELRKYENNIIPIKAKDYRDFRSQYENIWNDERVNVRRI